MVAPATRDRVPISGRRALHEEQDLLDSAQLMMSKDGWLFSATPLFPLWPTNLAWILGSAACHFGTLGARRQRGAERLHRALQALADSQPSEAA
ncbi:hypothetical protein BO71DRAFT_395202 [Aspergillus ellipticus CBS 707.79]|uniref:Uncharacterized protein n=1 Tax=Aspergillus ellipticus CBS 707.79 TaxID=1448320 RepID=A0A319DWN2_9EURO|nr:hypothetical protein BO71DRAFT_395202 [Aspergillus ellipticus CBS 707.79]